MSALDSIRQEGFRFELVEGVAHVVLDRPERINALTFASYAALRDTFEKFRLEELEHRDTALEKGAEEAPGYEVLKAAVKTGSKLAIWLSKRI